MHPDVSKILVSQGQIAKRVAELGAHIAQDCAQRGVKELTVIAVANGAVVFVADLLRALEHLDVRLDTVRVSSYKDGTRPAGAPEFVAHTRLETQGAHILLVDDILDTGHTLKSVSEGLRARRPASLKTCVLLNKRARREVAFEADFTGFEIPDSFVVGYGLDFAERYRNLPYIGVLGEQAQKLRA